MNRFAIFLCATGLAACPLGTVVAPAQAPVPAPKQPASAIIITNAPLMPEGAKGRAALVPNLSSGLPDIVRMFQAGLEEPVMLAFIQSSTTAYHPSAKEVIYLRDLGLSQALITALLRRGGDLRERAAEAEREERNRTPPPGPPPPSEPQPAPPSAAAYPTAGYPAYSTYAAGYPVYASYPAYSYAYSYSRPYRYSSCYPFSYSCGYNYRHAGYRPYPTWSYCAPRVNVGFSVGARVGLRASPWRGVGFTAGIGGGGRTFAGGGHRRGR